MNVLKECLIVNLQIGTWHGYKYDKATTAKVTNEAGAKSDAARVNKHLITAESLKGITMLDGRIRFHFYNSTLPWKDNGDRLIPRPRYLNYIEEHEKLAGERLDAVEDFISNKYPLEFARAEFRMGELFNEDDYPKQSELRAKFYCNLDIDAVSKAFDYRLNDNDAMIQARVNTAVRGLFEQIIKPLEHFANKVGSDEIFRDSCVNNLKEMVALIPELNFTDNEELEAMRVEIETKLVCFDASDLRKDKDVRKVVGDEAASILDTMRGFCAAFERKN